jgi:hypothetical protein
VNLVMGAFSSIGQYKRHCGMGNKVMRLRSLPDKMGSYKGERHE